MESIFLRLSDCSSFPTITSDQKKSFILYLQEIQNWNDKVRLTADPSSERLIKAHLYDSLQYSRAIISEGSLIDIGSGGGFPAIPLKILYPQLDMALIESRRKRVNFLKHVSRLLDFSKFHVIEGRAEETPLPFLDGSDYVVFRGFSELAVNFSVGGRFLKAGGHVVVQKDDKEFIPGESPLPFSWKFKNEYKFSGEDKKESCILSFQKIY